MATKVIRHGFIHKIAHCTECDWIEENFLISLKEARKHAEKTGHSVTIETGTWEEVKKLA